MKLNNKYRNILAAFLLFGLLLAGCDTGASSSTATPASGATDTPAATQSDTATTPTGTQTAVSAVPTLDKANPAKVTIALGYNPDVQFTPFYVALNKGYYKDEGVDVTFKHGIVPDLIKLLAVGDQGINFAVASGDEIIQARSNDIPVVYVMTWYRQYPVAAASVAGKGPTLKSPADLKGKTVGVPGPYGATYTGLLALLKAGGLTLDDITLKSIGFTQVESLSTAQVDAAMVYAANEPVQLRSQGLDVSTLLASDYVDLASNGLVTNEATIKDNGPLIAAIVRATQRGIADTISDPDAAFQEALKQVPEAGSAANKDKQLQVLKETVKLMQPKAGSSAPPAPGYTDANVWSTTQDFLYDAKLISKKGNVQDMFSNQFLPAQP